MASVKRSLSALALLCIPILSSAWIDTGHMVVAAIAQKGLKPSVKAEVDRLLMIGGDAKNTDFITTSPWADDIRRQRPNTGPWHYIDFHFRADGKPSANKPDDENAVWAIEKFSAVLQDKKNSDADRSEALRFLIHFVGDIHQPLHATARDTDANPKGDKGGNDFRITAPSVFSSDSRPPRNLHSFWDFAGGLYHGEQRPLSAEGKAYIDQLAATVEARYPRKSLREAGDLKPEDWASESFAIAKEVVYATPEGGTPSDEYVKKAQEVSGKRLALAGYRLSALLNKLMK